MFIGTAQLLQTRGGTLCALDQVQFCRSPVPSAINEPERGALIPNRAMNNYETCVLLLMAEGSPHVTYCLRSVGKTWDRNTQDLQKVDSSCRNQGHSQIALCLASHRKYFNVGLPYQEFPRCSEGILHSFRLPFGGIGFSELRCRIRLL